MKNLKKILALVLAFACAFTMFAGAAFTDQADIKATDAVNMLSSLGVITGYTDGSYQPNKVVTRAEMAKMIFVVRNNKIDDSAYQSNYSKLTDISNHWAKGYIKFCESQGIIAGKGNNKFDPDSPVTGVEAAKMLLVVSGYDSDKAGLTGSAWRTNVLKYAGAAGILDDVNSALEQGLPRQYAAQMIYNTLDVNRVKWSEDSKSFDDILNGGVKETVGSAYMGLSYDYGTLTSIDKDSLTIKVDHNYDADNYHDKNSVTFTKVGEDYTSLLGQKVKVMFKDGKLNNVLGVYAIADNTVYNVLMNKVEKDGSKVKFDGKSYSIDGSTIDTTFIAADGTQTQKAQSLTYFDKGSALNADQSNGELSTDEVTFIDADGNGKIDTAIVFEHQVGEVTYVSSDKAIIGNKTYKYEDENISKDIVKDDWAVISANLYDDCADIVKADVVNAELNGQKTKTGTNPASYQQFKIDGTWYNISDTDASEVSNGDTVKAYVVNGVIVKIKSDDGKGGYPTNVAVVVSNGYINGDQVKVRYFDGTSKTVTVSDNTTVTLSAGTAYKVSGSDDSMKFEALVVYNGTSALTKYNSYKYVGAGSADPSNDAVKDSSSVSIKVDDSAAVILYDGNGRSKMLTGKQYNALTTNTTTLPSVGAIFTKEKNGLTRAMMVAVKTTNMTVSGNSSDNYAYVVSNNGQNKDGNATYTIWTTNNEYVEVVEENATAMAKGELIGYSSIDSNKVIKDVTRITNVDDVATSNQTAVTSVSAGTNFADNGTVYYGANRSDDTKYITVDNRKFKLTADTAVLLVDSDADDDDQIGVSYTYGSTAMAKAEEYLSGSTTMYSNNVFFQVDENGKTDDVELKVLVIDSTGAFKGQKHNTTTTPSTPSTPGSLTKDNVTVKAGSLTGTSIAAVRVATGKAQVSLNLSTADASKTTVNGTVKATVDGASVAATGTIVGGQLQINITDDYVKANSVITIDLSGVALA